jgi:anti-sigma-K factor RskA
LGAVLLVLNFGLWVQVREVKQIEQQLFTQLSEDRIAQGLYAYPDVHRVLIEGENVYGSAIYEEYLQYAVLYIWGLEPLTQDQVYQAWLIEPDGNRISGGLFVVQEDDQFIQVVVRAPEMIKSFDAIGVTVEPIGGSPSPTGQNVLGVDL